MPKISDKKSLILESQEDGPTSGQKKLPVNQLWLFLCIILVGAWFTSSCSPFAPLSIEERVEKILSQTPLIGMKIAENYYMWKIKTDGLKQTVMMTFPSWSGNSSTTV